MDGFYVIVFCVAIFVFFLLDAALLISLIRPGDERRMLIVWKASTNTLGAAVGLLFLCVIENFVRGYEGMNPFIMLTAISMIYFAELLYYKQKHGN